MADSTATLLTGGLRLPVNRQIPRSRHNSVDVCSHSQGYVGSLTDGNLAQNLLVPSLPILWCPASESLFSAALLKSSTSVHCSAVDVDF